MPKEPPTEKRKEEAKPVEAIKPRESVPLLEKKNKPQVSPQIKPEPERSKLAEKKPPKEPEAKSEPTKVTAHLEKKNPAVANATVKEPDKETTKTAKPLAKAPPNQHIDVQEREKKIIAAVENLRAREEAVSRDNEINSAVERIRKTTQEKANGAAGEGLEQSRSARQGEGAKDRGEGKAHGLEFLTYTESIKQRVKDGWILPERRPGLTTVIRFAVEADGQVVDIELVEPSGDRAFDQSAIRAVKKANPLPPPPSAYREEFATQKVEVTFSGEERVN
jgi:TolA protein